MKRVMNIWTLTLVLAVIDDRNGSCQSLSSAESSHVIQIGQTQPNGKIEYNCGGSYLGSAMVVFGAHCANMNGRQPDIVRFGSTLANGINVRIANITIHYRYKPQFDYHNMAVAQLERNPQSISAAIKPACIMKPHLKSNTPVQLIGPIKDRLERTSLLAVGSEKCHEYYNPNRKLRFGVLLCCFCARSTNSSPCTTQHSSPLQIIRKQSGKEVPFLIGHKSVGKSCGTVTPAVYTRYGSYFEWLETVTGLKFAEKECFARY
ncbi:serine protease snake-like isoform X2 [Topomyia yanbarensis]|uniref:serine protease snake-like isoform X2 n=1 Tax=Topomyia yanbarensis TaxID=2498891 RepID=UPI00273C885C|nr:serine protease snake-like isoform X2 [Topomyia yanbarensis]